MKKLALLAIGLVASMSWAQGRVDVDSRSLDAAFRLRLFIEVAAPAARNGGDVASYVAVVGVDPHSSAAESFIKMLQSVPSRSEGQFLRAAGLDSGRGESVRAEVLAKHFARWLDDAFDDPADIGLVIDRIVSSPLWEAQVVETSQVDRSRYSARRLKLLDQEAKAALEEKQRVRDRAFVGALTRRVSIATARSLM